MQHTFKANVVKYTTHTWILWVWVIHFFYCGVLVYGWCFFFCWVISPLSTVAVAAFGRGLLARIRCCTGMQRLMQGRSDHFLSVQKTTGEMWCRRWVSSKFRKYIDDQIALCLFQWIWEKEKNISLLTVLSPCLHCCNSSWQYLWHTLHCNLFSSKIRWMKLELQKQTPKDHHNIDTQFFIRIKNNHPLERKLMIWMVHVATNKTQPSSHHHVFPRKTPAPCCSSSSLATLKRREGLIWS